MAAANERRVADVKPQKTRALMLAMLAMLAATTAGCFALFGLDGYGPAAAPEEAGVGDGASGEAAPADAGPPPKVVFVTSELFAIDAADGIAATVTSGHERCSELAKQAGLSGTFKAWLSTSEAAPSTEFAALQPDGGDVHPLVTPRGVLVAASYAELADSGPRVAIAETESRSLLTDGGARWGENPCLPPYLVWTGTSSAGTQEPTHKNCADWRATGSSQSARVGRIEKHPTSWTDACELPCNQRARLYCFEQ